MLELTIGYTGAGATHRVVTAADRVRIGQRPEGGIQLAHYASQAECEVVHEDGGFEARFVQGPGAIFANDEELRERRLATGDVLTFGSVWVDILVLDPLPESEIERAVREAPRLLERVKDPDRIAVAAAVGDLAATVAATQARIAFVPMFDLVLWLAALKGLPGTAAPTAALRLAREVLPNVAKAKDVAAPCEQAVLAVARWLTSPQPRPSFPARALDREVLSALDRTPHALKGTGLRDAVGVVRGCLASVRDWKKLRGAAHFAVAAGIPPERVQAFVSEELVRWALGK